MRDEKFKEPWALNSVALFHETFQHPILDEPQIPPQERTRLRINLMKEELDEFKQAILDNDLVSASDALCDLQYVLSGTILELGLGAKFKELFDEVQRSNMSKTCATYEEAVATIKHYNSQGQEAYGQKVGDLWLVYRKADDKTLKSINYSKADLKSILET